MGLRYLLFCLSIDSFDVNKISKENCARVFSNNELFTFYCNNSTSFESVFYMKTVKSRLSKKYLKRRKSRAWFCLPLGWLHISEKKL